MFADVRKTLGGVQVRAKKWKDVYSLFKGSGFAYKLCGSIQTRKVSAQGMRKVSAQGNSDSPKTAQNKASKTPTNGGLAQLVRAHASHA